MPPRATRPGAVNALIEKAGLRIIAQKRVRWSQAQAEKFYEVHKARPFYGDLVRVHDLGPDRGAGAGGRERGQDLPRRDGRHRPGQGRLPAPSARSWPRASSATRCMAPTAPRTPQIEIALNFKPDEIVG